MQKVQLYYNQADIDLLLEITKVYVDEEKYEVKSMQFDEDNAVLEVHLKVPTQTRAEYPRNYLHLQFEPVIMTGGDEFYYKLSEIWIGNYELGYNSTCKIAYFEKVTETDV